MLIRVSDWRKSTFLTNENKNDWGKCQLSEFSPDDILAIGLNGQIVRYLKLLGDERIDWGIERIVVTWPVDALTTDING
jgi:hypothetical protein